MDFIYTRVSTASQNLDSQLDTLTAIYPEATVITDKASGKDLYREGFQAMNERLVSADKVIVYDLSRLGRSTMDLLELVEDWRARGVALVVQDLGGQPIDTSSASGAFMFTMFAAMGQMQREIQAEKAAIGMAKAVAEGRMKGTIAPRKAKEVAAALADVDAGMSKEKAARANGIGVATLYRAIKARK